MVTAFFCYSNDTDEKSEIMMPSLITGEQLTTGDREDALRACSNLKSMATPFSYCDNRPQVSLSSMSCLPLPYTDLRRLLNFAALSPSDS